MTGAGYTYSVPQWYVIHTNPQQESRADDNLRAWNIETFTPKHKIYYQDKKTGKLRGQTRPLFPRYIFAKFKASELLHKVNYVRGVKGVISFVQTPVSVDEEIITTIKSRIGEDGLVKVGDDFKHGDKVVVKSGPLKDFSGIFQHKVSEGERVSILLTTVSYQARVVVESNAIQLSD